ncbi:DUF7501 family protein [Natronorarus salvus]
MDSDGSHPPRDSDEWANPEFCAFCSENLRDGGAGFMEHIESAETCEARFEA